MDVILVLGSIEDSPTARLVRMILGMSQDAPGLIEVDAETFSQEADRLNKDVYASRRDLLDDDGEFGDTASDYVKAGLLEFVGTEYLDGAEPASVVKVVITTTTDDWWPLDSLVDDEHGPSTLF